MSSQPFARPENSRASASLYTLDTMADVPDDRTPLVNGAHNDYGSVSTPSPRKVVFNATLKMAAIFIFSTLLLGGTLWLALPTLEEQDRPDLRIPKSFEQLQALNTLLKKYRDIFPYRILVCYVITYLFLQAFSLPGSMYLSILGGAVWGVPRALPLACACVASGATLCYLISAALGPALLTIPKFRDRFAKWSDTISSHKADMLSFLIVIRIAPLPPHWVVNVICPHVGIGIIPFWISTAAGIFGVSVIHTTIGAGLDNMSSAEDFHIISWKNFFGLSAVVIGVLIPVGLRHWFSRQAAEIAAGPEETEPVEEDRILAVGPTAQAKAKGVLLSQQEVEQYYDESDEDDDSDIILEAGPAITITKPGSPQKLVDVEDTTPRPSSSY
ncbi:hypothetical protein CYLTODRAFT_373470 [Cylindrobasidium torrendii FP15055 ss-10]|uniref:VTT domain-containing protein n=1 Tax=Cylindrobasidium torrendii FP15055 ss-10 TaxID=1314674 RepID=A0A0D7BEY5_9AGAR|nr:hypothetical protein CYLTODRAFT_373470 [Cylindrobasidium torrendii FP15055 ss-10]